MIRLCAALFLALITSACSFGAKPIGGDPDLAVVADGNLPAPTREDFRQSTRPYVIVPFDKLTIDVFGIDELSNKEIQADAGGRISFPLAGVIDAAGKTPSELEAELAQRLRAAYVRNPKVTVNLKESVGQVVTIDGEVKKPGLYPVIGSMSLMKAIASAEGVSEYAKLDDVVLFRNVGDARYAAVYNIKAIRRGAYPDPEIYPNDVIVVGDSQSRRILEKVIQGAPLITTPLIVLLR